MRRAAVITVFMIGELGLLGLTLANCSSYGENDGTPLAEGGAAETSSELPGCDATKDPVEELCLVAEGSASVFVSTHGNDGAKGTRSEPVLTIERGIELAIESKKARVIVCEGTYPEVVQIKGNVSALPELGIHGGFKCPDWTPSEGGRPSRIVSRNPIAMRVSPSSTVIKLRDLDLVAADGDASFKQSIGIALTNANIDLKRVRISAGNGFSPPRPGKPPTNLLPIDKLAGNPAAAGGFGPAKVCTCPRSGSSTGGKGGANGFTGEPGTMNPVTAPLNQNGGGTGGGPGCSGSIGRDGRAGDAGAGAATFGTMDPIGFIETAGGTGGIGTPGQGGGGAGGAAGFGGGSGGCGQCGGAGGSLGEAGGSSIGILAWQSKLTITDVEITTGKGGNGADGGDGEVPNGGGRGDPSGGGSCMGGLGGKGGPGGGGGGGAGGSSVGVLYFGDSAPVIDGAPLPTSGSLPFVRIGAAGAGGAGGSIGGGKGIDGKTAAVFLMPSDLVAR